MTRQSTIKSAKELFDDMPPDRDPVLAAKRNVFIGSIKNEELKTLMSKGIAYHNAGVVSTDRSVIEDAFRQGLVQALFSTSTLAMGVNLPAYMVVLKGVHKVSGRAMNEELSETELMQMTGRAGRPQFGDHGVAVIICPDRDTQKYQRLINGEKVCHNRMPLLLMS
jgi:ATP-dependent DNA helicase HFM1/MER3